MRREPNRPAGTRLRCDLAALVLALALPAAAQESPSTFFREPPEKIMTAERCGECHVSAYEVWKETPHATGFKNLHRKESAEAIAEKMGFRLIKRESLCLRCHYTATVQRDQLRAASGVSCESCHGAGRDWIEVHNDYGAKGVTYATETAEHREERIRRSRQAGMRRPEDLFALASSCFGCHLVPEETLVNQGGHSTGSGDFELVARSQGEIRHNFLQSFLTGDGTHNAESSAEHQRVMYVTGRALELEHTLRAVAAASEEGVYVKAMIRRSRNAVAEMREIAARAPLPEIETMLRAVKSVRVGLGKGDALTAAADKIASANRAFIGEHDGTQIAALDPLVLGLAEPAAEDELAGDAATDPESPAGPTTEPSGGSPAAGATTADPAARPRGTTPSAPRVVGERKTRIRTPSDHQTLGQGSCSGCHAPQNEWWFDDAHYSTTEPFFDGDPKNVQIARLYGVKPSDMTRGNQVCMDCHGTVVSGKESREVLDGVSCESCHGPAKDWLEPHKDESGKELGRDRPGYKQALGLGKADLTRLDVRAAVCTSCHYITEPRLISAGHPSGADHDYVGGMEKVRHWQRPLAPAAELASVFASARAARGAVPDVPVASLAAGGQSTTATAAAAGGATAVTTGSQAVLPRPPRPRPTPPIPIPSAGDWDGDLPPMPAIEEETTVEEILLLVKERLELLARATGR